MFSSVVDIGYEVLEGLDCLGGAVEVRADVLPKPLVLEVLFVEGAL